MPSSPSRRATIIRPASAITAAPVTVRLTNSSSSTVWTPDWVARKAARSAVSGEVTVTVPAADWRFPVSAGMAVLARFRSSYSACAWSAVTPPTASGNSQFSVMPYPPNAACTAPSWPGSANTPPAQ